MEILIWILIITNLLMSLFFVFDIISTNKGASQKTISLGYDVENLKADKKLILASLKKLLDTKLIKYQNKVFEVIEVTVAENEFYVHLKDALGFAQYVRFNAIEILEKPKPAKEKE